MKAKELKENIYNKLVSLNYSRKENFLNDVDSTNWFDLDDELKNEISKELPANIPHYFISSLTNNGLVELKDALWQVLTKPVA